MSYRDPTYVIFDGDEDNWAYRFMRGWKANENVEFDFRDAHDIGSMTSRAENEDYVKRQLRDRMSKSSAVVLLVGEKTKNLYKYVRWELELALDLGFPIIVVNLNDKRRMDPERCPAIVRDACAVHIPFKMRAIKHALDNWTGEFRRLDTKAKSAGARHYNDDTYRNMGLRL